MQELKYNIQREIFNISRQNLCLVSENIFLRREACSEDGDGQQFETVKKKGKVIGTAGEILILTVRDFLRDPIPLISAMFR